MDWMFLFSQNSYVDTSTLNVTVFRDRAFMDMTNVKWGHRVGPWSSRINILIRKDRRASFLPAMWGHNERAAICKWRRVFTKPYWTLIWDFQLPELRKYISIFELSNLCCFVMVAQADQHSEIKDMKDLSDHFDKSAKRI